jgi:hypothetical protein
VFKHIGRISLAALITLALGVGLTLVAGSASASSSGSTSASACSSQQAQVVKAKKKVKKDKKKLKKAKKHHKAKAVKKAKKKLRRDRKKLHRAKHAYQACLRSQQTPPPPAGPAPGGTQNPVTEQCLTAAGQLAAQDPSGTSATGADGFCDLLGQLVGSTDGDPAALCDELAAQDPSGELRQLCTGLGSLPI